MGNVIPKATIFRRSTSKSRPADKQCRNTLALWTKSARSCREREILAPKLFPPASDFLALALFEHLKPRVAIATVLRL
jgi:hypothetical protein